MSNLTAAVGIIALIVVMLLCIAAYPAIMGSAHEDAVETETVNLTGINVSYEEGQEVAQGYYGFSMGMVYLLIILLIIVVWMIIFKP